MTLPRLLRAEDIAEQTGLSLARVYALVRAGQIPHIRVGRSVRFSEAAILAWIERGGSETAA